MRQRFLDLATIESKRSKGALPVNKAKGSIALTFAIILCLGLLSFLSSVPAKAAPGDIVRVSTSSSGVEFGDGDSPSISSDGRYVAFSSGATNLVEGDTNGVPDIFRKDLLTGQIELVSSSSSAAWGNHKSEIPSISSDGRYVAFRSDATNLVSGDTNGMPDIFRKDLTTGETVLVSTSSSGAQGNRDSYSNSISSDGRYVAFLSAATNLVSGDTNDYYDIFRKDLTTGETVLVSTTSSGAQGNDQTYAYPSISSDGRYVAFLSDAINLVEGDTRSFVDVFRKDLLTGQIELVSTSSSGSQGNDGGSNCPSISSDGRYVAFLSDATNLVSGDTNGSGDIFRKDLVTGETVLVSTSSSGAQGNRESYYNSISSDGRYVAFDSYASNLVEGDTNSYQDVFRKDLVTGQTVLVSTSSSGVRANRDSVSASMSSDGKYLAFSSAASNLVDGDMTGYYGGIFRKELPISIPPPTPTSRTWGHDSIGITTPAQDWFLAEGCTNGGFETWVLVQNPQDTAADVQLTYMTPSGPVTGPGASLPPNSRKSFNVGDTVAGQWEVSTKVSATRPVIAERAVYGPGRAWGTDSIGASETSKTWYLAEGCTNGGFESWILVQNPNNKAADVNIIYMTPEGQKPGPSISLPANSRKTFNVADVVPGNWDVSTFVSASDPVVAERAVYWNGRKGAHDSIGVTAPEKTWYLAEGCTNGGFETWVLVQNPGDSTASIDLSYMTDTGEKPGPHLDLAPHSRKSLNVADGVPNTWSVSTKVTSKQPVIAERAVYWNGRVEGHDSIGTTEPAKTWYLAEGCTGAGFETWVLVQNPNSSEAKVQLTYMTPSGPVAGPPETVAPNSRKTFNMAETVPGVYEVSTKVTSNLPVIAERAMYGDLK